MDNMREEFERIYPIPAGVIRCGSGYAATDWGWESRDYVNAFEAFSEGWKASRAALCVKLPCAPDFNASDEPEFGFDSAIESVKVFLDDAGVRYE